MSLFGCNLSKVVSDLIEQDPFMGSDVAGLDMQAQFAPSTQEFVGHTRMMCAHKSSLKDLQNILTVSTELDL